MVACNSKPEPIAQNPGSNFIQQQVQQNPDTAGLARFNAWKTQNELATLEIPAVANKVSVERPVSHKQSVAPVRHTSTPKPVSTSQEPVASNSGSSDSQGTMNSESGQTAKAEKKEGWSKAAKGAVIGGVAGAAGGAVLNKQNRVVGAVVGAVIGAGGGYAIGRGMDKKDGRID